MAKWFRSLNRTSIVYRRIAGDHRVARGTGFRRRRCRRRL